MIQVLLSMFRLVHPLLPPGFENGSGNKAVAAGSVASGGVPVLPAFGGAAGNGFLSNPLGEGGLDKVEGMFAAMMSEMKSIQGSVHRMEGGRREVKDEVGKLRVGIDKVQADMCTKEQF